MKLVDLLIDLRKDVRLVIGSVQDSNGGLFWDNTRPNWSTRAILQELYDRNLAAVETFGIYLLTRHCDCPNEKHSGYPISKGRHGIKVMGCPSFLWIGEQTYQGDRSLPCPCTPNAKITNHPVIDELVIRRHGATNRHHLLVSALTDLHQAIQSADDKKPRSAIREWLLLAVLKLNDAITPQTVDEFIASRSKPVMPPNQADQIG